MKVHFKGTRGSIPTSPNAAEIRQKVINALLSARGKDLRSEGQIRTFVDETLNFRTRSTWGGNTPCVHIETGSPEYIIMDAGSGIRVMGKELMAKKKSVPPFISFSLTFITIISRVFPSSPPPTCPAIKLSSMEVTRESSPFCVSK